MHFRPRTWAAISLFCLLMAAVFWHLARRAEERARASRPSAPTTNALTAPKDFTPPARSTPPSISHPATGSVTIRTNAAKPAQTNYPHRLSNTTKGLEALLVSDHALLLRNALIDSSTGTALPIPAHLRATGEPGAYVVQARGVITESFRAALRAEGAEIVSYVPNNAYLVRATPEAARRLEASPAAQSVLPWEPYFKLDSVLLALAVERKPMPGPGTAELNLLLFPGQDTAVRAALEPLGVTVTATQPTPFGPHLTVRSPAPADTLLALAALPGVQVVERSLPRLAANDITRGRLRVSTNTSTLNNHLSLSGAGVLVAVNDFGVQAAHPDLTGRVIGRVPSDTEDLDGHGTHVAGIIASSGANGPSGTNASGSVTNAHFRGMAHNANLFSQIIGGFFGPPPTDTQLQESAVIESFNILPND